MSVSLPARVLLDGALVPENEARISPLCDGFQYGYGLFETLRVQAGAPVFFAEHEARLRAAAAELGLVFPSGGRARCARLLAANGLSQAALKWILYQGPAGTAELIALRPFPYGPDNYRRGFALHTRASAAARSPHKSLNYLDNIRAKRGASSHQADEPLFVDAAGRVLEGATTNVFAVERGRLLTPPLSAGLLPGIARGRILRLHPAEETPLPLDRLLAADEVFVTNALLGVMPVRALDGRAWDIASFQLTPRLSDAYEAAATASALPPPASPPPSDTTSSPAAS